MTQVSASAATSPGFRPALATRIAILGAAFIAEKVFLNGFVDSRHAAAAHGSGAILRATQHWGFRFLAAFAAALILFAYARREWRLRSAVRAIHSTPIRPLWILAHVLFVVCLIPLSSRVYRGDTASQALVEIVALSSILGLGAMVSAILAMGPWRLWWEEARALRFIWVYASIAALLATGAWRASERLWDLTAGLTFDLVRRILLPVIPALSADSTTRVISTNRFGVEVTEVCSGLEGMGLMLAFTAAWLVYFRREYIFPRALLLIPAGLAAMFALNVLRIAALLLIGHAGFPDVASSGFHSQAGWIAFIAVACTLVFFSRRSTWLNRVGSKTGSPAATHNPTGTYLMPLLVILAAGSLSHAMSGGFETFYPLRLVAGLAILTLYRHRLMALDWRWSWRGPLLGVVIFAFWIVCAYFLVPAATMPEKLASMSPAWRGIWITSRVAAAALTVPVAEELAYRGFLMRRLSNADFESVPFRSVGWFSLTVTAVVFGLAHGALWFPGIAAGMAFGLILVRRGSLGEAVAAHVTTNALIAACVLGAGQWQLW